MQKPWSFRAIEFIIYVQIGFVLGLIIGLISFVILSLIANEVINLELPLRITSMFWEVWWRVMAILGDSIGKGGFNERLGELLGLSFEFVMSSVILIVLKTKRLLVIKRTTILALIIRAALGGYLIYPHVLPLHIKSYTCIFMLCSILAVAFLSLKQVQYYTIAILTLIVGTAFLGRSTIYPFLLLNINGYTFIFILGSIFVVTFLFLKPVQRYIQQWYQRKQS